MKLRRVLPVFALLITSAPSVMFADVVDNFDAIKPEVFQFKDTQGSRFIQDANAVVPEHNSRALKLRYEVIPKGYAGWGMKLNGMDVSGYKFLQFNIAGEKGGEKLEIGLKDMAGVEKKIQSSSYFDISNQWQLVKISLTAFEGMNLRNLDNLTFSFNETHGSGMIYVDDIAFEGKADDTSSSDTGSEEPSSGVSKTNRVLIDGFERPNPSDQYIVKVGEDSTLALESSRLLHDGDYAMSMEYAISSQKALGTWVIAHWEAKANPLDWTGVEAVKLWIKGDGTDNIFRFSVIDPDGEVWSYEDLNAMKSTRWSLLSMPVKDFFLSGESKAGNQQIDYSKVQAYEIGVFSKAGSPTSGKVWVDQLYITGSGLSAIWSAPPATVEKLRMAVSAIGNIDLSGIIYTEYLKAPEISQQISQWGKIIANAKVNNYSGRIEFASQSQNFSDAAYLGTMSNTNVTGSVQTQSPGMITPSIQVMGNNISSYFSNVTLGNLWFDYNKYTFSGAWGWKGLAAEGDMDRYNYHFFYISQPYESYTAGTRWIGYWPEWKVSGYSVVSAETAKIQNYGQIVNYNLTNSQSVDVKPIFNDTVYYFEALRYLNQKKIQVQASSGWNKFYQGATEDNTDPYHPVYNAPLDTPLQYWDSMYKGRVETNNLIMDDMRISAEYRRVGTEFKPRYRQNPAGYDDAECDQKGYNARVQQLFGGWQVSAEYDNITRISNPDYYRLRANYGFGYYGYSGLDAAINVESKREQYIASSTRSQMNVSKNDKVLSTELYIRNQLTPLSALWFKLRTDGSQDPESGAQYETDSLYAKYEYYMTSNAKFYAEFKTTRYPQSTWEPKGYPYDDNFVKASFEFTF
jgi:hypothetical protein